MLRRIIGVIMVVLGLAGLVISGAGVYFGRQAVDSSFGGVDETIALTTRSLETAVSSLELAKATVGDVNNGLDTVEIAALDVAKTVTDTRPLLDQVTVVVSTNAPASVEAMQAAVPALADVAATIDQTLVTLSAFEINENILGVDIQYDLGIDYEPEIPFDEAFELLGTSLDGLPEELRSVEGNLAVANENLAAISDSITAISADIDTINGRVAEVPAQIDQYIAIVQEINTVLTDVQTSVTGQQDRVKLILTFVLVWWGLPQLALVMIGWDFLFGRRGATAEEIAEDVLEDIQDELEEMKEEG